LGRCDDGGDNIVPIGIIYGVVMILEFFTFGGSKTWLLEIAGPVRESVGTAPTIDE
jgi:hypothetical protein